MSAPSAMLAVLGNAAELLSPSRESNLMTVLLILVLLVALVLGLVTLLMVVHFTRSARLARHREMPRNRLLPVLRRFQPSSFAVPNRWLAIRSPNPHAVQAALGLLRPRPCSWEEGLSAAQDRKLFISPSVDGWILVMGSSLPEPGQDVDKCFHFIVALSQKLGAVQFFNVNPATRSHAWVQADHGQIQRAYAWAGQTLWNQGRITKAELDLRLKCFDYADSSDRIYFDQIDPTAFNAERVPHLAARCTVDPSSVHARMPREIQGIAGELARSRKS